MHARVALSNQLRAELERFWPGPIGLFSDLDSPISLAFLERYPSPADARGLGEQRLAGVPGTPALLRRPEARAAARQAPARARGPRRRGGARRPPSSSCSRWSRRSSRSSRRSSSSTARSPPRCARTRTARSSSRCSRTPQRDHAPPSCWRRSATAARATQPATRSPPTPARPLSRSSPANARQPASAGAATSAYAQRSARWPTPPATGTPGRKTATPPPAPAATTTHARLRTVGRAWCRDRLALLARPHPVRPRPPPRPATAHHGHHPHPVGPPPRPRCHPADGSAPPSPTGRPNGPSAKRLTASRHPLTRSEVDTGRLLLRALRHSASAARRCGRDLGQSANGRSIASM